MGPDGNVIPSHARQPQLIAEKEWYHCIPSAASVKSHMDYVVVSALENSEVSPDPGPSAPNISPTDLPTVDPADDLSHQLSSAAWFCKVSAVFGSSSHDEHEDRNCPLFTTSLDELESIFQSEISAVNGENASGVSPTLLSKLWSILEDEADKVVAAILS